MEQFVHQASFMVLPPFGISRIVYRVYKLYECLLSREATNDIRLLVLVPQGILAHYLDLNIPILQAKCLLPFPAGLLRLLGIFVNQSLPLLPPSIAPSYLSRGHGHREGGTRVRRHSEDNSEGARIGFDLAVHEGYPPVACLSPDNHISL